MMNRDQIEKWERRRSRGRLHYILFTGILSFGLLFALLGGLFDLLIDREPGAPLLPQGEALTRFLLGRLAAALIVGAAWGAIMWYALEREYRKSRRS